MQTRFHGSFSAAHERSCLTSRTCLEDPQYHGIPLPGRELGDRFRHYELQLGAFSSCICRGTRAGRGVRDPSGGAGPHLCSTASGVADIAADRQQPTDERASVLQLFAALVGAHPDLLHGVMGLVGVACVRQTPTRSREGEESGTRPGVDRARGLLAERRPAPTDSCRLRTPPRLSAARPPRRPTPSWAIPNPAPASLVRRR